MYEINGKAVEYVADERELVAGSYGITDEAQTEAAIDAYLRSRVAAAIGNNPGRPVLQLSGGIDSILLATYLAEISPDALAVTYSQGGSDPEGDRAAEVASRYGFEHVVVRPSPDEFERLLVNVVDALEYPEPWEVSAGVVLVAVDTAARKHGATGALLSGAGADALFMGGHPVRVREGESFVEVWDSTLRDNVARNFKRERFIPDFYERLLERPERHVQIWQTHAAVELAQQIHPSLMQPTDPIRGQHDKYVLRQLAVRRGIPEHVAFAAKNPMQISSGLIDAIVAAARRQLERDFGDRTYTSPAEEPLEFTVARLYLHRLAQR